MNTGHENQRATYQSLINQITQKITGHLEDVEVLSKDKVKSLISSALTEFVLLELQYQDKTVSNEIAFSMAYSKGRYKADEKYLKYKPLIEEKFGFPLPDNLLKAYEDSEAFIESQGYPNANFQVSRKEIAKLSMLGVVYFMEYLATGEATLEEH